MKQRRSAAAGEPQAADYCLWELPPIPQTCTVWSSRTVGVLLGRIEWVGNGRVSSPRLTSPPLTGGVQPLHLSAEGRAIRPTCASVIERCSEIRSMMLCVNMNTASIQKADNFFFALNIARADYKRMTSSKIIVARNEVPM